MMPAALRILLEAALRALLAACVLWVGLRLLRVRSVPAQKTAWGMVLLAALAMPLLMRWQWLPAWAAVKLPAPAWGQSPAAPAAAAPAAQLSSPASPIAGSNALPEQPSTTADRFSTPTISTSEFDTPSPRTLGEAAPAPAAVRPANPAGNTGSRGRLLVFGWLFYLGVGAALLLRLFFGLGSSLRLWMHAKPAALPPDLDLPSAGPVRASRRVASPVNIGSGILLPADYARWDREKLRVVLAHERSHVRQRDFYLQLLAGLYAALTWFSPLGWWLKRKLAELGEAISDRAGLAAAASPSAYAELLLEFAALPRPTLTGVAMAHSTHLSQRIERFLNDASFRQAFAGSRRALAALLLVPAAIFAATALVRVQAAAAPRAAAVQVAQTAQQSADQLSGQSSGQSSDSAPAPVTGQSHPDEPQVTSETPGSPSPVQAPSGSSDQVPPAPPQPAPAPAPPAPEAPPAPPSPDAVQATPGPPAPPTRFDVPVPPEPPVAVDVNIPPMPRPAGLYALRGRGCAAGDGDAYAIVGDPGTRTRFCGDWDGGRAEIDKARSMTHGYFLLFRHDGKPYIVDDPAIAAQIQAMEKPMDDLGAQMRELGKQMRDAGQQDREAARQARQAARQASEANRNITVPDLSKELADLNAAMADLKAKEGTTITREQLGEIERKFAEVQRKLMSAQIKVDVNLDMSAFNKQMSEFNGQMGKFSEQMGSLGAQMGRIAQENDRKIRAIIDESLKDGKARPVN